MLCKECGGRINYVDGDYICDSCGRKEDIKLPYEKIDVFICDSSSDDGDVFDKESQMVQQVYDSVKKTNANAYVQKRVIDEESIEDLINLTSANTAKVLIFVSSSKDSLASIYDKYSSFLNEKTIITLYSGFAVQEFPEELKKYQALNFDSIGSMKDLQKGISETLGIKPSEVEVSKLFKTDYKLTIIFSVVLLISIVVLILRVVQYVNESKVDVIPYIETSEETTSASEITEASELSDEEIFEKAKQLSEEGKYADAIDLFETIHDYDHSVDELSLLFSKYAGYYYDDNTGISFHLNKTSSEAATISARMPVDEKTVVLSEDFVFTGTTNSIQYTDSFGNMGSLVLELYNDEISFVITTTSSNDETCFGDATYTFKLSDRSDKPQFDLSLETIKYWLSNDYNYSDFVSEGYSLIPAYYVDEWAQLHTMVGAGIYYRIENTDIYLVFFDFDVEFGAEYDVGMTNDDPKLYAVGVDEGFLSGYGLDIDNPFEYDDQGNLVTRPFEILGLYVMPAVSPEVMLASYGYDNVSRFLIVDDSFATEEFKSYILAEVYGEGENPLNSIVLSNSVTSTDWWLDNDDNTYYYGVTEIEFDVYFDLNIENYSITFDVCDSSGNPIAQNQTPSCFSTYVYCVFKPGYALSVGTYTINVYAGEDLVASQSCEVKYAEASGNSSEEDNNDDEYVTLDSSSVSYTEWIGSDNGVYTNVSSITLKLYPSAEAQDVWGEVWYEYYYGEELLVYSNSDSWYNGYEAYCGYYDAYTNEQGYLLSGEYYCAVYDSETGNLIAESTCTVVCE